MRAPPLLLNVETTLGVTVPLVVPTMLVSTMEILLPTKSNKRNTHRTGALHNQSQPKRCSAFFVIRCHGLDQFQRPAAWQFPFWR